MTLYELINCEKFHDPALNCNYTICRFVIITQRLWLVGSRYQQLLFVRGDQITYIISFFLQYIRELLNTHAKVVKSLGTNKITS